MKRFDRHTAPGGYLRNSRVAFASFFSLVSLVVATVLFASCQGTEEELPLVGQGSVLAQFNISISNAKQGRATRMTDAVVQQGQDLDAFRGIQDIVIKPFGVASVTKKDSPIGDNLSLKRMIRPVTYTANSNYIPSGTDYLYATSQSALYEDVDIPLGTCGFLFYGKAIDEAADPDDLTDAQKHQYGILTPSGLDGNSLSNIQFQLNQIDPSAAAEAPYSANIVDYLNKIAQARNSSNEAWSAATNVLIKDLYKAFIGQTSTSDSSRPLGGSSRNVMATVQELYNSARESSTEGNMLSGYVLDAILNSTPDGSTRYATDSDDDGTLEFNTALLGNIATTDYFPANIGLPDGAAVVAWKDGAFEMVTTASEANSFSPNLNVTDVRYYVYPPSLYYFANSAVKASNSVQRDNITDAMPWEDDVANGIDGVLSLYSDNVVGFASRSVIMADPAQYGVGMLELRVKCKTATLKDQANRDVNYTDGGFPITAVLVGNQRHAGFDFTPVGDTYFSLYDNVMPSGFKAYYTTDDFSTLTPSRSLVLESDKGWAINVAVEFTNNSGRDFYGNNGDLISQGCKFYLIAQLTPVSDQSVFQQDYVTRANLTIESLANAYNVVPDLRLPKLDLGLLVNLDYQTGIQMGTVVVD